GCRPLCLSCRAPSRTPSLGLLGRFAFLLQFTHADADGGAVDFVVGDAVPAPRALGFDAEQFAAHLEHDDERAPPAAGGVDGARFALDRSGVESGHSAPPSALASCHNKSAWASISFSASKNALRNASSSPLYGTSKDCVSASLPSTMLPTLTPVAVKAIHAPHSVFL